jgi:hypothetical protein
LNKHNKYKNEHGGICPKPRFESFTIPRLFKPKLNPPLPRPSDFENNLPAADFITKLQSKRLRVIDHIPNEPEIYELFKQALLPILQEIIKANTAENFYQAWLSFFKFPQHYLVIPNRGGDNKTLKALRQNFKRLLASQPSQPVQNIIDEDIENLEHSMSEASRIKKAESLFLRGHLSKAVNTLTQSDLEPVDEDTFRKVAATYISNDTLGTYSFPTSNNFALDENIWNMAIKKSANHSACASSLWAPDHFKPIVEDREISKIYMRAAMRLLQCPELRTPPLIALVLGIRLILPTKEDGSGDRRTISVQEPVLSHLQEYFEQFIDPEVKQELEKLGQYGIGTKSGVERVFHAANTAIN